MGKDPPETVRPLLGSTNQVLSSKTGCLDLNRARPLLAREPHAWAAAAPGPAALVPGRSCHAGHPSGSHTTSQRRPPQRPKPPCHRSNPLQRCLPHITMPAELEINIKLKLTGFRIRHYHWQFASEPPIASHQADSMSFVSFSSLGTSSTKASG